MRASNYRIDRTWLIAANVAYRRVPSPVWARARRLITHVCENAFATQKHTNTPLYIQLSLVTHIFAHTHPLLEPKHMAGWPRRLHLRMHAILSTWRTQLSSMHGTASRSCAMAALGKHVVAPHDRRVGPICVSKVACAGLAPICTVVHVRPMRGRRRRDSAPTELRVQTVRMHMLTSECCLDLEQHSRHTRSYNATGSGRGGGGLGGSKRFYCTAGGVRALMYHLMWGTRLATN